VLLLLLLSSLSLNRILMNVSLVTLDYYQDTFDNIDENEMIVTFIDR
jgi:hypothetical protein